MIKYKPNVQTLQSLSENYETRKLNAISYRQHVLMAIKTILFAGAGPITNVE